MRIGKQDSYIESFGAFKAKIAERYEANLSRTDAISSLSAMSQSKANAFDGTVLTSDGNVVLVPYSYGSVVHYDVSSDVYVETALTSAASARFSGGCLANNGNVIMAPLLHGFVGIYNPATKAYADGPAKTTGYAYRGAICVSDTLVLLIPANATTLYIGLYNPEANTLTNGCATISGAAYEGGCLLPDGRVFLSPTAGNPAVYDPKNDTLTEIVAPATLGNNAYSTSVCLHNGWVVMCPRSATIVYIWDSIANVWIDATITVPSGSNKWRGGLLAQNGDVILIPNVYDYVGRIKIDTLSYVDSVITPNTTKTYQYGAALPDGRMIFAPYNDSASNPVPLIYTPCTQGVGYGAFVTQSRFMNHK